MKYINNEKVNNIKLTKNNFYVAIDFDKTITSKESCDSYDASGNMLGEEYKKKNFELYQKYAPVELNYTISFEDKYKSMEEWYNGVMSLFYKYHLTEEKLNKSVNTSNLIFRAGAKDFLHKMYKNNIPVIILSAGIGNVIEHFLKKNGCYYDNIDIISNFIKFDKIGKMEKYNDEIIHTLNKTMDGHITRKIAKKIEDRQYRLLFGDFIEDKKMVPIDEWDKTIAIRIFG